jgi:hypothetical protein
MLKVKIGKNAHLVEKCFAPNAPKEQQKKEKSWSNYEMEMRIPASKSSAPAVHTPLIYRPPAK